MTVLFFILFFASIRINCGTRELEDTRDYQVHWRKLAALGWLDLFFCYPFPFVYMRLGLHGVGKQVILLLLSCHIRTRHETGLVSPWQAPKWPYGISLYSFWYLGKWKGSEKKMQSSALVRRYLFYLCSQGLRKLRRNSEKWKNFMYIEPHNQISREIIFYAFDDASLVFRFFSLLPKMTDSFD